MHILVFLVVFFIFLGCSNSPTVTIKNSSPKVEQKHDLSQIYEGHTFDVYLNGKKVVHDKTLYKQKEFKSYHGSLKSIQWKAEEGIEKPITIEIKPVNNLTSYIGYLNPNNFEVAIFPLQKVHLRHFSKSEARQDVLVNGSPLLTQKSFLKSRELPVGEYLLRVKVYGSENWDSKEVFFSVKKADKANATRGTAAPFAWHTLALGKYESLIPTQTKSLEVTNAQTLQELESLKKGIEEHKIKRNFAQALVYQNKLTQHYESTVGASSLATADMYNNQALLHQEAGEYEEALNYNQKSLEIKLKYFPQEYAAISINYDTMGTIYYAMGQEPNAVNFFKKSLEIREKHFPENDSSLAESYNNIAVVFARIGNHKEALENLKKALKIRLETVGEQDSLTASLYSLMGSIYEHMERYKEAEKFHQKSISIHEALVDGKAKTEALASAYGAMGTLLHKRHKYDGAIRYYLKMLKIRESLPNATKQLNLSEVYNNLGVSYMYVNLFEKSKSYLEKAIALKEEVLGKETTKVQEEYKNLGWLYFRQANYKEAFIYAKKSVDLLLKQRDNFFVVLDATEYENFLLNNQKQLDLLFQCAYYLRSRSSYEEAFSYWLKYKGTMLDNQNRITSLYAKNVTQTTQKKIHKLLEHKRKLSELYQQKVALHQVALLSMEIQEHQAEINRLKEELFGKLQTIEIDFKTLVGHLSPEQIYIDFARIGPYYFGFAVDADGKIFLRRISTSKTREIDKYVLSFRKKIRNNLHQGEEENTREELSKLYTILLKTLTEKMLPNKNELIVSADGLLRLLPFEALFSKQKKQYLIEYKEVQYIASGREFLRLQEVKKVPSKNDTMVLFANPKFDKTLSANTRGSNNRMFQMHFANLKGTEEEAKSIRKIMSKQKLDVYEGTEANENNLLEVKQPKVLHIATHGFLIKSKMLNPMLNAGLALTGANSALEEGRGEGVVTALKLSGMNLKGTELVVLSACETALVGVNAPDSVSLLSKAFMQAGAKAIIASLWSVSDKGTKTLMERFYQEIAQGHSYLEALKRAKVSMIHKGISPAVWSAFILNGDE